MVDWCKNKTKTTMTLNWKHITRIFFACIFLILVCEVLIYYVVLLQCSWPNIDEAKVDAMSHNINEKPLRVMILSDTHLLGFRNGHWFDKLRREWQMYRSFQSVMSIHSPEVIFFLGDLFDEGLWADDDIFQIYVSTFRSIFHHSSSKKSYVVAGNHDIGFHYSINKHLTNRFMLEFDAPPVKLVNIRGNHFVLINSMAMEGDKCFLCKNAEKQLHRIVADVNCSLHFPLYRQSNQDCDEPDADESVENFPFRPKWECLSKESTDTLLSSLKPRAVFSGHSHHSCFLHHKSGIPEWTVASFNWRNKHNPSFILAIFTPNKFIMKRCFLPDEITVLCFLSFGNNKIIPKEKIFQYCGENCPTKNVQRTGNSVRTVTTKADTDSQVNILPCIELKRLIPNYVISTTSSKLTSYSGHILPVEGVVTVPFPYKEHSFKMLFFILSETVQNAKALIGLPALREMGLIEEVNVIKEEILKMFADIFKGR
ncbi:Metallophosphoesterase 1 [Nymphon striatum]|nr:Metallophosphoesterase 1 [Nymphon striatum]